MSQSTPLLGSKARPKLAPPYPWELKSSEMISFISCKTSASTLNSQVYHSFAALYYPAMLASPYVFRLLMRAT